MIMISKQSSSSIIVIALALVSAAKSSIAKHGQITKMVSSSNAISTKPALGKLLSLYSFSHKSIFMELQ
jgi:hypothetical protein